MKKAANIYERNYNLMEALGFLGVKEHAKLKSEGFMNLAVEVIGKGPGFIVMSLTHYGVQNGDLMADPDMEVRVYPASRMVEALTWRNDYVGAADRVYHDDDGRTVINIRAKRELNRFLAQWLRNLKMQGFRYEARVEKVRGAVPDD